MIGIAPNIFYGTGIPACVLVINKNKPNDKKGKVLIINGANEYKPGKAQNSLTSENITRIVEAYRNWQDSEKLAKVVSISEIAENDYNLNITRYVNIADEEEKIDVAKEVATLQELTKEWDKAEQEMMHYLKELGYVN